MNADELIASLAAEGAKKPLVHPLAQAMKWLGVILVYFMVVTLYCGLRHDLAEKIMQSHYIFEVVLVGVAAVASVIAAGYLALPDAGQRGWVRFIPIIPLVFIAVALLQNMVSGHTITLAECLKSGEYECMIWLLFHSIIPTFVIMWSVSRAAPTRCCWAGAMAGLAAGSAGYLFLRLVDEHDDATMLMVWHFIPVLFIVMLSALAGKLLLKRALA